MNSIDPLIPLARTSHAHDHAGDVKRRALRFAAGCLLLGAAVGAWFWWRRDQTWPAFCFGAFAAILLVLAALKPRAVLLVRGAWLTAARYVGTFNTLLILTLLYFLAVVPIGLIGRLFGHDRLGLRRRRDTDSYWHARDVQRDRRHFERPS